MEKDELSHSAGDEDDQFNLWDSVETEELINGHIATVKSLIQSNTYIDPVDQEEKINSRIVITFYYKNSETEPQKFTFKKEIKYRDIIDFLENFVANNVNKGIDWQRMHLDVLDVKGPTSRKIKATREKIQNVVEGTSETESSDPLSVSISKALQKKELLNWRTMNFKTFMESLMEYFDRNNIPYERLCIPLIKYFESIGVTDKKILQNFVIVMLKTAYCEQGEVEAVINFVSHKGLFDDAIYTLLFEGHPSTQQNCKAYILSIEPFAIPNKKITLVKMRNQIKNILNPNGEKA